MSNATLTKVATWNNSSLGMGVSGACGTKAPMTSGACGTSDPMVSGGCGTKDPVMVSGGCGTQDPK